MGARRMGMFRVANRRGGKRLPDTPGGIGAAFDVLAVSSRSSPRRLCGMN